MRGTFSAFFSHFFVNNLNPKRQNRLFFFSLKCFPSKLSLLGNETRLYHFTSERSRSPFERERTQTIQKHTHHHEHHWHDGSSVEKRGEYWRTSLFIRGRKDFGNITIKDEPREDFIFIILDEKRWIHLRVISRRVRFERFFVE